MAISVCGRSGRVAMAHFLGEIDGPLYGAKTTTQKAEVAVEAATRRIVAERNLAQQAPSARESAFADSTGSMPRSALRIWTRRCVWFHHFSPNGRISCSNTQALRGC